MVTVTSGSLHPRPHVSDCWGAGAAPQVGREGQEGVGRRHGRGADTLSTEHEPAARCPAASAQPDAAGLDHVPQVRLLTRDLQLPEVLPVGTGHQVARAQAPAHGLEGVAPTLRQRPADRGVELFDPARVRAELLLLPGTTRLT